MERMESHRVPFPKPASKDLSVRVRMLHSSKTAVQAKDSRGSEPHLQRSIFVKYEDENAKLGSRASLEMVFVLNSSHCPIVATNLTRTKTCRRGSQPRWDGWEDPSLFCKLDQGL